MIVDIDIICSLIFVDIERMKLKILPWTSFVKCLNLSLSYGWFSLYIMWLVCK